MGENGAALAFSGRGVEIVGVEDEPEDPDVVRIYVGARYRGLYFTVDGPRAEQARRDWRASYCGHLLMHRDDVPQLCREAPGEHDGS